MRLHYLHLLKYGKFTDARVEFPPAEHDFHLVVGPNEAGKSTLRSAMQDLLYGIPLRSPLDFVHRLPELCLGAMVGDGTSSLEFKRIKANANTVRGLADEVIPDQDLANFLGASDRVFYRKMFALDHGLLIEGGRNLLNAQDDLGQMLFQSAAGIASLGKVRDALTAEGNKLWAPRKAADREYYIAQDKLVQATADLKHASIRAKSWSEAHAAVTQLAAAGAAAAERHQKMQVRRMRLERLRRTAPHLAALQDAEARLAALGQVADLPEDAGSRLDAAQQALAAATQLATLHGADSARAAAALSGLAVDQNILAHADEIGKLAELRQRFSDHENDIVLREREVDALWQAIRDEVRQLGWPDLDEHALRGRLPPLPLRRSLTDGALAHGALALALQSARQAMHTRRDELVTLRARLSGANEHPVTPALRSASSRARAAGDTMSARRKLQQHVQAARALQASTEAALAPWQMTTAALLRQQLPTLSAAARMEQDRQGLITETRSARRALDDALAERDRQAGELAHFEQQHHPVDDAQVAFARTTRDAAWDAMRQGAVPLKEGAAPFEAALRHADALADRRLDQADAAARLQGLRDELRRAEDTIRLGTKRCETVDAERAAIEARWRMLAGDAGIAGMSLEVFPGWCERREQAIAAHAAHDSAKQAFDNAVQEEHDAAAALHAALAESGHCTDQPDSLAALCEQAAQYILDADERRGMRQAWQAQLQAGEAQANALGIALQEAQAKLDAWTEKWSTNLAKSGLDPATDIAGVKGALELIEAIDGKLDRITGLRRDRIDTMRADLRRLDALAAQLAETIDPTLATLTAAQIATVLQERLAQENDRQAERVRLQASLEKSVSQQRVAEADIARANGEIAPLLSRAGVADIARLNAAIAASMQKTQLMQSLQQAHSALIASADGLTRAQITGELATLDMTEIAAETAALEHELAAAVAQQTALAAEHAQAEQAFAQMTGSDTAATAEARRQEALAQMSDAAERYVRVATAARLLRWSIEKYRERKQGPMLARASAIFRALTLGVFTGLHVDFDQEPMALEGMRADRPKPVGVNEMSEGTRDQLYFALRMAALELHLAQAVALPFVADDLFINYDDDRARAGLRALKDLSTRTQVIFLSHHAHLEEMVRDVFGARVNVCALGR